MTEEVNNYPDADGLWQDGEGRRHIIIFYSGIPCVVGSRGVLAVCAPGRWTPHDRRGFTQTERLDMAEVHHPLYWYDRLS